MPNSGSSMVSIRLGLHSDRVRMEAESAAGWVTHEVRCGTIVQFAEHRTEERTEKGKAPSQEKSNSRVVDGVGWYPSLIDLPLRRS